MSEYSNELLSLVPVRAIITHVRTFSAAYSAIYPSLMVQAVMHFPQLFDTPSLLMPHTVQSAFDPVPLQVPEADDIQSLSISTVESVFKESSSATLLLLQRLHAYSKTTPEVLLAYPFCSGLFLLSHGTYYSNDNDQI